MQRNQNISFLTENAMNRNIHMLLFVEEDIFENETKGILLQLSKKRMIFFLMNDGKRLF